MMIVAIAHTTSRHTTSTTTTTTTGTIIVVIVAFDTIVMVIEGMATIGCDVIDAVYEFLVVEIIFGFKRVVMVIFELLILELAAMVISEVLTLEVLTMTTLVSVVASVVGSGTVL